MDIALSSPERVAAQATITPSLHNAAPEVTGGDRRRTRNQELGLDHIEFRASIHHSSGYAAEHTATPKTQPSAAANKCAAALSEPSLDELLTHARRYYSDAAIHRDMHCLVSAATSDDDRRVLKAYARLRRAAPGYAPGSWQANSHGAIPPEGLERLAVRKRTALTARAGASKPCAECGTAFAYARSTARYCSDRCSKRARRAGRAAA